MTAGRGLSPLLQLRRHLSRQHIQQQRLGLPPFEAQPFEDEDEHGSRQHYDAHQHDGEQRRRKDRIEQPTGGEGVFEEPEDDRKDDEDQAEGCSPPSPQHQCCIHDHRDAPHHVGPRVGVPPQSYMCEDGGYRSCSEGD